VLMFGRNLPGFECGEGSPVRPAAMLVCPNATFAPAGSLQTGEFGPLSGWCQHPGDNCFFGGEKEKATVSRPLTVASGLCGN